jgi:Ankyrin repeats (3 copies)
LAKNRSNVPLEARWNGANSSRYSTVWEEGADPSIVAALLGAGVMPDLLTAVNMERHAEAEAMVRDDPARIGPDGGDTIALHLSINKRNLAAIRWLLAHGIDVNAKRPMWACNHTALHMTTESGAIEIAQMLLPHRCDAACWENLRCYLQGNLALTFRGRVTAASRRQSIAAFYRLDNVAGFNDPNAARAQLPADFSPVCPRLNHIHSLRIIVAASLKNHNLCSWGRCARQSCQHATGSVSTYSLIADRHGVSLCPQNFFQLSRVSSLPANAESGGAARTEGDNLGIAICNAGKGKQKDGDQTSEHTLHSRADRAIICKPIVGVKIARYPRVKSSADIPGFILRISAFVHIAKFGCAAKNRS